MAALTLNKSIFNPSLYSRVRTIWFQDLPATALTSGPAYFSRWFGLLPPLEKASFDAVCRTSLSDALASISPANHALPPQQPPLTWAQETSLDSTLAGPFLETLSADPADAARDALAVVILLDQIPRNIFRGNESSVVYTHYDRLARSVARSLLSSPQRLDAHPSMALSHAYRSWFYLPLMHSEFPEDHERYLEIMRGLRADAVVAGNEELVKEVDLSLDFEDRHYAIIKKFGRYPYRNAVLGRETTEEEKKFLEDGGDTFGTKA